MSYPYCARRYGSFDTHIAIVYDTLCHATLVIKCHQMSFDDKWRMTLWVIHYGNRQYGYQKNRIDEGNKVMASKHIFRVIYWRQIEKKQISQFFLCKCLCNKIDSRGSTSRPLRKLISHFLDSGDIGELE